MPSPSTVEPSGFAIERASTSPAMPVKSTGVPASMSPWRRALCGMSALMAFSCCISGMLFIMMSDGSWSAKYGVAP